MSQLIDTEHSPTLILELIYRLKIRDVMTRTLLTATPEQSLRDAQRLMKANGVTGLPVIEGRRLVGIVSMDDVIRALDEGYIDNPIETHMTRGVIVLEEDMPLSFAINYLDKYRFGRFPVLNAGKDLVGIITSRDVIMALLLEINKEIERFEAMHDRRETTDAGFRLEFSTRRFDFEMAGRLSTEVKKRLTERNYHPKAVRRVAVACYELEMNQVVHSHGGTVRVTLDSAAGRVEVLAKDTGPGIPNVELALQEGYSTATEWVRSLGFGAGMGLPNVKRVSDYFDIQSSPTGTAVHAVVEVGKPAPPATEETT